MLTRVALACAASLLFAFAEEMPLLPQPRSVRPGAGQMSLDGAKVVFEGSPDSDDKAVLRELDRVLEEGVETVVSPPSPAVIVLRRTSGDSSWQWDDAPGPASSESYRLDITPRRAELEARTSRGLFYAVQTLRQLIRRGGGHRVLPAVEIEDWPAMRLRGVMLDLSHGPFPKFDELKRQIDFLATWKTNQFYLYSETNIELDGFPLLSPRARLSKAQVRELIAYAQDRFIDVVPCVEFYGHLHDLVRIEQYSGLGETPHGGEINPRDPDAFRLIEDWVGQLTELFPSPFFHVGMDETYELGKMPGRELPAAEAGSVYLGFFEKVSHLVASKNRRVMVWGDIILQHPEVIPRLPAGTIAIPWRYSDEADYDRFVAPLAQHHVRSLLGSGVWNYYDAAPGFDHTLRNVDGLGRSARKYGSLGLVHTEWTDDGQVLFRMADPAVAYGPVAMWNSATMPRSEYYGRYARLRYPDSPEALGRVLALVSESQEELERAFDTRVMLALWADPFDPRRLERARAHSAELREGRRKAEDAQAFLVSMQRKAPVSLCENLLYGARLLDYIALRQIYAAELDDLRQALTSNPKRSRFRLLLGIEGADHTHSRLFDLMDAAGELQSDLRRLWLDSYEPFRLETALGRWRAEFERWRHLQQRLADAERNYRDGDRPPELTEP